MYMIISASKCDFCLCGSEPLVVYLFTVLRSRKRESDKNWRLEQYIAASKALLFLLK